MLIVDGRAVASVAGLSAAQAFAVEAALSAAPPPWHDGLVRDLAAALAGPPPWDNDTVMAALATALGNNGVKAPFLFGPQVHYIGARFAASSSMTAIGT
jgi:hypothetical protein